MSNEACDFISVDNKKVMRIRKAMPDPESNRMMANVFKVLSDSTRLKIVSAIELEELCVCDIAALTELTQSLVSHHLRTLRQMNIVKYRRNGKMAYYSLTDSHIKSLLAIAREHAREAIR
jgi:ArsR family transcriptional regulator